MKGCILRMGKKGLIVLIHVHIAVVVDCSGSMYGEPMEAARIAIRRFTEQVLKPYRTMAIFASPLSQEIASFRGALPQCLRLSWDAQHPTRRGGYIEALGARKAQRME